MKNLLICQAVQSSVVTTFAFCIALQFSAVAQPKLEIRRVGAQSLRIAWPTAVAGYQLERTASLTGPTAWEALNETPQQTGGEFSLTVGTTGAQQFFHLHEAPLTFIRESSPASGEQGVAVTRETIVRFSSPLADDTALKTNNFYATFAGRRILSRTDLSSDRRTATLFYLEPLPGSARVSVFFDAEGTRDLWGRPLDPAGTGQANGFKLIQFDTLSLTALAGTAVVGRVFASELQPGPDTGTNAVNRPLEGVTISVDGMEETLRTTTDAMGNFKLEPAPPGRFFVHIDGRTAKGSDYPNGAYYPFVGKAWDAVAGRTNNLAGGTGDVFLPLIKLGTLQPVSASQDTTIKFPPDVLAANPALDGVSVTVPANALFSDNGARGGRVGIAPVPPDRLPGPLPPGLQFPLVITVQTDGALNFDRPVPACFPNLRQLPPGEKSALISFNHDRGEWEVVGPMTVSADGKLVCTDPGVGILQPGWHGDDPRCPGNGGGSNGSGGGDGGGGDCPQREQLARIAREAQKRAQEASEQMAQFAKLLALIHDEASKAGEWCKALDVILLGMGPYLGKFPACEPQFPACEPFASLFSVNHDGACLAASTARIADGAASAAFTAALAKLRNAMVGATKAGLAAAKCDVPGTNAGYNDANNGAEGIKQDVIDAQNARERIKDAAADAEKYARLARDAADQFAECVRKPRIFSATSIVEGVLRIALDSDEGAIAELPMTDARSHLTLPRKPAKQSQLDASFGPLSGLHYYVVEDVLTGQVALRGTLVVNGDAFNGIILAPHTYYRAWLLHAESLQMGYAHFFTDDPGTPAVIPPLFLDSEFALDTDSDGLSDAAEFVAGTDPQKIDTDGDGIPDVAEVVQGTNPTGGLATQTGIIATARTPGPAVDVCVSNDLAVVAEGASGVAVFNLLNGLNPTIVAQVDTPGNALRVACTDKFVAVADGAAGLAVIDISDPTAARLIHQVPLGGDVTCVVVSGGVVYAGTASGSVAAVDLQTATIASRAFLANGIVDVALAGDYLYVLTADRIFAVSALGGQLIVKGSAVSPVVVGTNKRLFAGGAIAYATHGKGYNTFSLDDPAQPVLIAASNTAQFGWKQIVANGSGLGVAAVGLNSTEQTPATDNVWIYNVSDPTKTDVFLTAFDTPGIARAVSIFDGLAYVADDTAGLQVVNYLAYDTKGRAPSVTLITSFGGGTVEEGKAARVSANVNDDVQARQVEFYLDGERVLIDGSFPFEMRFVTPRLTVERKSFRLRARGIDTGGNAAWSDERVVQLTADITPPTVLATTPLGGGGRALTSLFVYFSEPIDPATLTADSFLLFAAGPDRLAGTADDLRVAGGKVSLAQESARAELSFRAPLSNGLYRAVLTTGVTDAAGNRLATDYAWPVRIADAAFWIRDGNGFWHEPFNWSSGTVPGPGESAIIDGPFEIRLERGTISAPEISGFRGASVVVSGNAAVTLDAVTLSTDVLLEFNAKVRVLNGLTLNGTATLHGGLNLTELNFDGSQTFDGTGQVVFTDSNLNTTALQPVNGTLTIGSNIVIRGVSGRVGNPGLPLVNHGTVVAESRDRVIVFTGSSVDNRGTIGASNGGILTPSNLQNNGLITLTDGTLNLTGSFTRGALGKMERAGGAINVIGTLDNIGQTLTLDASTGSWQLAGGTILGGTVRTSQGAQLIVPVNSLATLDGVTVNGDLLVDFNGKVRVVNGLTVNGTATLNGGLNITELNFDGTQALEGTGEIVFTDVNPVTTVVRPIDGTLTIGADFTIRGGAGTVGNPTLPLINQGTISADGAGRTIFVRANPFTNAGETLELNGGRILINP